MPKHTPTLLGATGLIGSELLTQVIADSEFDTIRVLTRRPLEFTHPKVQNIVLDFADLGAYKKALVGSDIIFSAIGTTQKQVKGDKAAYRKVDYDIPMHAAQLGLELGVNHFLLVSSVGANAKSKNFYLQLKGEVEENLTLIGLPTLSIFRPSLLLGKRKEYRFGEAISQAIMPAIAFLFPKHLRPIQAKEVAKAMIAIAKNKVRGTQVYQFTEMKALF